MTEYIPPYETEGAYLQISNPSSGSYGETYNEEVKYFLVNDNEGSLERSFFERLGNPGYDLKQNASNTYKYQTTHESHGFTLPNSTSFKFHDTKKARFNEIACPIDNQRRCKAYFLCFCNFNAFAYEQLVGEKILIRYNGEILYLPWSGGSYYQQDAANISLSVDRIYVINPTDYRNLSTDSTERSVYPVNEMSTLADTDYYVYSYPVDSNPDSDGVYSSQSLYVIEASDEWSDPGKPGSKKHVGFNTGDYLSNLRFFSFSDYSNYKTTTVQFTEAKELEDFQNGGNFFAVHPAVASSMEVGELYDFTHLANGWFGKGTMSFKPGVFANSGNDQGYLSATEFYVNSPKFLETFGIFVKERDYLKTYPILNNFEIETTGFKWVENLLSSPISIHSTAFNTEFERFYTDKVKVKTLLGEHHWWDTSLNSNSGGVSSEPFFRVQGTAVRDGTAEEKLETSYPQLFGLLKESKHRPITIQLLFDTKRTGPTQNWILNLKRFCFSGNLIPETVYIRLAGIALNAATMDSVDENGNEDGTITPTYLLAPGYDESDIQNPSDYEFTKFHLLEIDIVPLREDVFPTTLPIVWSGDAFQFFYDKATGDEATAINRLQNSILDYGYEVMTVGQDYYDNTNTASTNYPAALVDEEYSKAYRENISRLVSTYSEWEFPSHLSELPATASDRDSVVAFGIREPAGHRIIVSNINCIT